MRVRPLTATDFPAFFRMQSNPQVMQFTGLGRIQNQMEARAELEKVMAAYQEPNNGFWVWALERKEDKHFLGTAALVSEADTTEIGYRLDQAFWQKGLGQEICDGLLHFVFSTERHEELVAYAAQDNRGSVRILDRSSMALEKVYFNDKYQWMDQFYRWSWTSHLSWSARAFLDRLLPEWEGKSFQLPPHSIDHLCYRVATLKRYERLKEYLGKQHRLLVESEIAGRPIATFALSEPWVWQDQAIEVLELPAPKPGAPYLEGFEHFEVVVPSLEQFLQQNSYLNLPQAKRPDPINPTIKWALPSGVIKFHERSLAQVIALEKAQRQTK